MFSKIITCFIGICALCIIPFTGIHAEPTLENLYTNPEGKKLPEAIIFYDSANSNPENTPTINLIINILRNNYQGQIHVYLIDINRHPEFISAFNLSTTLNLVLIRISDGASFGYKKITDLTAGINDIPSYTQMLTEKIDNFLSIRAQN